MSAPVLAMNTTWAISSLTLNTTDANGVEWLCTNDDGWFNAPGEKLNQGEWPSDHGMWDGQSYVDSRLVTLDFAVTAPTRAACDLALRILAAVGTTGQLVPLTVTEPGLTTFASVKRAQKPNVTRITETYAEAQIFLIAPDPRRYDPAVNTASTTLATAISGLDWSTGGGLDWSTGGGLNWGTSTSDGTCTVLNNGTAPSPPIFTIAGPTDSGTLSAISVTNSATGQIIAYSGVLGVNDVLVINTNRFARSATLNGSTDVWSGLTISQWYGVPDGGQLKVQFQGTSSSLTPLLQVGVSNAYY